MAFAQVTRRRQHYTDLVDDADPRLQRRRMQNWCNLWRKREGWEASNPRREAATGAADDPEGFGYHSLRAPLQCSFHDAADAGNRAMVGCRLSRRPEVRLSIKPMESQGQPVNASQTELVGNRGCRWRGIYQNTHVQYDAGRDRLKNLYRFSARGHPTVLRSTIRLSAGFTLEEDGNGGLWIRDAEGEIVLRQPTPYGWDSSTTALTIDGRQYLRARLRIDAQSVVNDRPQYVVLFELRLSDLGSVVYPCEYDPTTVISGTVDIEDGGTRSGPDDNRRKFSWGGRPEWRVGIDSVGSSFETFHRVAASAFPSGNITAFRFIFTQISGDTQAQNGGTIDFYTFVDAATWVEGTADNVQQVGSACFWQKELNVADWPSGQSTGGRVIGTDLRADATQPTEAYGPLTSGPDVLHTVTLKAVWASNWRDAVWLPNGFMIRNRGGFANRCIVSMSEHGTDPSFFEVDFTAPAAGGPIVIMAGRR